MLKYGIFGNPVASSKSPEIYNQFCELNNVDAFYNRFSTSNSNELIYLANELNLDGFNITAPLKSKLKGLNVAIPSNIYNTSVKFEDSYQLYNTDKAYLSNILTSKLPKNKRILIIGAGDTGKMAAGLLHSFNLNFDVVCRNPDSKFQEYLFLSKKIIDIENLNKVIYRYDIIINTLKHSQQYLNTSFLLENQIVIDSIYQEPFFDKITCKENYHSGLEWLIEQAKYSIAYYFPEYLDSLQNFLPDLSQEFSKSNIILIGYMGAGKTSIAKELSYKLNMNFIDTDELIENVEGQLIADIFEQFGEETFRRTEYSVLNKLKNVENTVISLGGASIFHRDIFKILKLNSTVIWIYTDISSILQRVNLSNRPLYKNPEEFLALFETRKDDYFRGSDLVISNNVDINVAINKIYNELLIKR